MHSHDQAGDGWHRIEDKADLPDYGQPLSKQDYDERYNVLGPNGEPWHDYPPNDGAVPGSRIMYESGDAFPTR